MSKPLSTFERKMKNSKFRKAFEKSYKEFVFSELITAIMEGDAISARELAHEYIISGKY